MIDGFGRLQWASQPGGRQLVGRTRASLRSNHVVGVVRDAWRLKRTRLGLGIGAALVLVALFGPWLAPHSPYAFVGLPNSGPSAHALFGTDGLGRDVLSRWLNGGRTLLWMAVSATLIGVGIGALAGLTAAYSQNRIDDALMRGADVILCIPEIVLLLVLVAAGGSQLWLIVLAIGLSHAARTARVMRGAGLEVAHRDFVQAAEAVGEPRVRIVFGQLLPNVSGPLLVEFGLRMTFSIGLIAAASFLGLGVQPPTPEWGVMINENREALTTQPWGVVLPVVAIALFTLGTNLVTDGVARAAARFERKAST